MALTATQQQRYSRHLLLDGFDTEGQERLLRAKVLVVGAGGLGSPVSLYLAAAGVGTIGIVDGDEVALSNLQRQVMHTTAAVGTPKVDSAAQRLSALNPDVQVERHPVFLTPDNAAQLIAPYDFVLDCTDNFVVKYLINDVCVQLGKPFSMGGIAQYSGQLMTHVPGTADYRCIFPEPPHTDSAQPVQPAGVLGSIVGILGTMQATECIKYLTGVGELLTDTLLTFDARDFEITKVAVAIDN